jgi:hypothetical protein
MLESEIHNDRGFMTDDHINKLNHWPIQIVYRVTICLSGGYSESSFTEDNDLPDVTAISDRLFSSTACSK